MEMPDEEAREKVIDLTARVLAIREVVARLVAYESLRWPDPTKILENFSDATAEHIYNISRDRPTNVGMIAFQEKVQKEVDWIVAAARKMGEGDAGS
jgi:hypothetical protein